MAPPANRRPGYSRRAQYGLFLGYVIAVAGMLVAVLLLVISIVDPRGFAAIKGAALDLTAPVSGAGRAGVRGVTGIGDWISNYINAGSQNAGLQAELAAERRELVRARIAEAENARLRRLLGLAQRVEDEVAIARIVGSSFDSSRRMAILSAGSAAGVRPGQPVRAPDGLIGRVLDTGRWASRILLVSDGASSVPVRALRTGTPALAAGRGDGTVELRTLEVGENPFRVGDIVVTSGVGGIFPPDVPVAVVTGRNGDTAIARPLANPARTDFAIVQPVYQPAAVTGSVDAATDQLALPPVAAPPQPPQGAAPRPAPIAPTGNGAGAAPR